MKKQSSSRWPFILFALAGVGVLLQHELALQPDGKLYTHFLDVGQGDAALIVSPSGKQIIIDGGPNLAALEEAGKLMPFFDRTIDMLVLTHPHSDHLVSMPAFLRRYNVKQILLTGMTHKESHYEELIALLEEQKSEILFADPDADIDFGDGLRFDVIWPPKDIDAIEFKDVNDSSVVIKAIYGEHSILFTGDVEEAAEKEILAMGTDLRSTVLKSGHHGSKTSSSTGFLLAVNPELVIISAGKDNTYGHPSPSVLERYDHFNIPYRRTDLEGTVSLAFSAQ